MRDAGGRGGGTLMVRGSCWAHLQKKGGGLSPGRLSCASSNKETLPVVKGRLRGVQREC